MHLAAIVLVLGLTLAGCVNGQRGDDSGEPVPSTGSTTVEAGDKPIVQQEDAKTPDQGTGQPIPHGNFQGNLLHHGVERTYELHVPPGLLTNESVPLLVFLHPALANAAAVHGGYKFDAYADQHKFILVYPDGTSEPESPDQRTWNALHCCGTAHSNNADDIGFLYELIAKMRRDYPIDANHIGLAGHSNGAMMSHRFAAEHSELVSSITAVAGTIGGQEDRFSPRLEIPAPSSSVSVQIIHAYDDPIVTYYGGPNRGTYERNRLDIPVRETTDFWRNTSGAMKETGKWSDGGVDYETYIATDGTEVYLVSTNGGHGWPGSGQPIPKIVKVPTAPDATALAVDFFVRH